MEILVSVFVITYNSSRFVLETLESIKDQTYRYIELIISDDCSTDDTVDLCKDWIEKNKERFVKSTIITASVNTGVTANCNRAVTAAKGNWLKGIAGDDVLMPNCIQDNVNYILQNPAVFLVQSKNILIDEASQELPISTKRTVLYKQKIFNDHRITAKEQHKLLLYSSNIIPATLFFKKEIYDVVGGYDESIPMMEDRPFNLNVTSQGYKFHYFPETTVKYRIHNQSIVQNALKDSIVNRNQLSLAAASEKYVYPYIKGVGLFIKKYHAFITKKFYYSKQNSRNFYNVFLWKLLTLPDTLNNKLQFFIQSLLLNIKWIIKYQKNINE